MKPLDRLKATGLGISDCALEGLAGIVAAALASAKLAYVPDSLNDIAGPGGLVGLQARAQAEGKRLYAALKAAEAVGAAPEGPGWADPQLLALVELCPAPEGVDRWQHAAEILDALRRLSVAAEGMPQRVGGRPPKTDVLVEVAVRATMHFLHSANHPWSGGWKYEDRPGTKPSSRSNDRELSARGPARVLVAVVQAFGLGGDHAAIKTHHDEFVRSLRRKGRGPEEGDYMAISLCEYAGERSHTLNKYEDAVVSAYCAGPLS